MANNQTGKSLPPHAGPANQPQHRPRHLYLLVHKHQTGVWVQPFWYEPNARFPYPETNAIIKGMKLEDHIDTDAGDMVYLQEIPPDKLPVASWDRGHGSDRDPDILIRALEDAERDDETLPVGTSGEATTAGKV